jgi:hypothetical protein
LQLQESLPEQTSVAELGESVFPKEHDFQSFGFRNPEGTVKIKYCCLLSLSLLCHGSKSTMSSLQIRIRNYKIPYAIDKVTY